eukprot:1154432-Pelagomonas_calceolata.AAC.6
MMKELEVLPAIGWKLTLPNTILILCLVWPLFDGSLLQTFDISGTADTLPQNSRTDDVLLLHSKDLAGPKELLGQSTTGNYWQISEYSVSVLENFICVLCQKGRSRLHSLKLKKSSKRQAEKG